MRITGGTFRSRTLVAPRGRETRPTSDRVREALFSILAAERVVGADREVDAPRVLDLYAGSGALAFEALSRGAASAVVVESGRAALAAIRTNARALGVEEQVTVLAMPVARALSQRGLLEPSFELVMLDPPYADVQEGGFHAIFAGAARLLAASGILVLEHATSDEPDAPNDLLLDRRRKYGDTSLSLFRRRSQ